jgi:hypothetical protein
MHMRRNTLKLLRPTCYLLQIAEHQTIVRGLDRV